MGAATAALIDGNGCRLHSPCSRARSRERCREASVGAWSVAETTIRTLM